MDNCGDMTIPIIALAIITILACEGTSTPLATPRSTLETAQVEPTATVRQPTSTAKRPEPTSSATAVIWTLKAPKGITHVLFCEEVLTKETTDLDCALADLESGTKLKPLKGGCKQASWDASYTCCHVKVLDGEFAGKEGWINQKFISK